MPLGRVREAEQWHRHAKWKRVVQDIQANGTKVWDTENISVQVESRLAKKQQGKNRTKGLIMQGLVSLLGNWILIL